MMMNKPSVIHREISPHQFRMCRLQVLNWGTFSDLHDIQISEKGFLFTGRSGSGKSTLLDAIAALLVQPGKVEFNAAAREGERTKKGDRSAVSYLRGAYAEQTDDFGEIATQYLRPNTTRSALALSYRNQQGKWVVLVQLLYIRGTSNNSADVKRLYMIFERNFDLSELSGFDVDIRKIKQAFSDEARLNDEFKPYSERLRRLLGIENEMALTLLHKTQSAKNLGELNSFLRTFMLDEPDTFDVAARLISEFGELDQAHLAVLDARNQIAVLRPAHEQYLDREKGAYEKAQLLRIRDSLECYREVRRCSLLQAKIVDLSLKIAQSTTTREQIEGRKLHLEADLATFEHQHRELGGDAINRLENDKLQLERSKTDKLAKLKQASDACKRLGWQFPNSPEEFVSLVSRARDLLQECINRGDEWREQQFEIKTRKIEAERALAQCRAELVSLRKSPSNIPSNMQLLRKQIASAISVHEDSLPFAGELIEVLEQEVEWRGVIERVLHNLAQSMLVEDKHYNALTNYVNSTHLGARIVYIRTGSPAQREERPASLSSMFSKLKLKGGIHRPWLESELKRINYDCVSSVQAFKNSERPAITKEGLIKSNKNRHEKDDRKAIDDRRFWILGFDNREKVAIFEKEEKQFSLQVDELNAALANLIAEDKKRSENALCWQTLNNLQWQEIDVAAILERLAVINEQLSQLLNNNSNLTKIGQQIDELKQRIRKIQDTVAELGAETREAEKKRAALQADQELLRSNWKSESLLPTDRDELNRRFASLQEEPTLSTLDRLSNKVDKTFENDISALDQCMSDCKQQIEKSFADFKRMWPSESANMGTTLASATDYIELLRRLENDNLPKYEEKFFELLRTQSNQNLAALNTHLSQARKTIYERMELVNESLRRAFFNPGTYLQILTTDKNLAEVKEFRQRIADILSHAWTSSGEQTEIRFNALRELVKRLSSQEWADKRWQEIVLDVRQHVEFVGQEVDSDGREIETYRSGAGKSGGQRQKLATTCLAAALHYQLSRSEDGVPTYAAVVLDEAFDKADHEFTAIAMNIFDEFGFQMIVATPIKSVMTLEAFIGGACFVDIRDRKHSTHLAIQYDSENSRLKLSNDLRQDVESATTLP